MARAISAGLLVHRAHPTTGELEVLLGHPGGPFFARRDLGSWSIPKGEMDEGETARATAYREFGEETGLEPPLGEAINLGSVVQAGGKVVLAYALAGDPDLTGFVSNTFTLVWPSRSGVTREFPELDRIAWFGPDQARTRLVTAQAEFIDRLEELLSRE